MEKNNLNTAPTEQELYNAGFKEDIFGCLSKTLSKYLKIVVDLDNNKCRVIGEEVAEKLLLTKQKINDAFALFNQPLPQWEKPKPKVGEVYKGGAFDEENYNLIIHLYKTGVEYLILNDEQPTKGACTYTAFYDDFTKTHDTPEDYYKEKFLKEQTVIDTIEEMNKEIFKPTTIDPKSQIAGIKYENQNGNHTFDIVEKECTFDVKSQEEECYLVHQYSYKGLKADGKIPHDRSGEDYESIEAFKKLLAICEALNGMFRDSGMYLYNPYWDKQKQELFYITNEYQDESPIYFTSKEAFDAFKSAPENVELFKTFLKLK